MGTDRTSKTDPKEKKVGNSTHSSPPLGELSHGSLCGCSRGLACLALHRAELDSPRQRETSQPQEFCLRKKLSITGRLKPRVGRKPWHSTKLLHAVVTVRWIPLCRMPGTVSAEMCLWLLMLFVWLLCCVQHCSGTLWAHTEGIGFSPSTVLCFSEPRCVMPCKSFRP